MFNVVNFSNIYTGLGRASEDDDGDTIPTYWTIMVYYVGDADKLVLPPDDGETLFTALNNMEKAGSNQNVNIVAQVDDYTCWEQNTRRFLIKYDTNNDSALDFHLKYEEGFNMWTIGEQNSGDPDTLKDFIQWSTQEFPAEHYGLICFAHGAGWEGYGYDATSGWTLNSDAYMDVNDLESAFNDAPYLDILFLHGCSMGQIEVFYQLKEYAKAILASESGASYCPAIYLDPFSYWVNHPSVTYEEIANQFVETYEWDANIGPRGVKILFAILTQKNTDNTYKIDKVAEAVDQLSISLLEGYSNDDTAEYVYQVIKDAFNNSVIIVIKEDPWVHELYEFAKYIYDSINEGADEQLEIIKLAAKSVLDKINDVEMIKPENADEYGLHGFAIYSPKKASTWILMKNLYADIKFCNDSQWDEFLIKDYSKVKISTCKATTTKTKVGEQITFYGAAFGGVEPYTYQWDFGDGNIGEGERVTHTYTKSGNYKIKLTATDSQGYSATEHLSIGITSESRSIISWNIFNSFYLNHLTKIIKNFIQRII